MPISLALALSTQALSLPPSAVNEFPASKVVQVISNALTCTPSGSFSVDLRWRHRKGVVSATVKRQGEILPLAQNKKLVAALHQATDLLYVQTGCSGSNDAMIKIVFVGTKNGQPSDMALVALVRFNTLGMTSPVEMPLYQY